MQLTRPLSAAVLVRPLQEINSEPSNKVLRAGFIHFKKLEGKVKPHPTPSLPPQLLRRKVMNAFHPWEDVLGW